MLVHMGSIIICVLQIFYLNNGYKKTILSLSLASDDAKNNLAKPIIFRSLNRVSASISEALSFGASAKEVHRSLRSHPCFSVLGFDATHRMLVRLCDFSLATTIKVEGLKLDKYIERNSKIRLDFRNFFFNKFDSMVKA